MGGRNHVPPPDSAPAPNTAPGRMFFDNASVDQDGGGDDHLDPPVPAVVDLAKPNLTRLTLAEQLYLKFLNQGFDPGTAQSMADAQALLMIP